MRKLIAYLLLVFFLFNGKNLIGQEWWNRYSKQEREKILLEKAKEAVLKYSDERYYTTRIGYKIDSSILFKEIAGERKREVYRVFFLYDSTKVRFVRKYLAKAIIPKDTCEVIFLTLGTGFGPSPGLNEKITYKELENWEAKTMDFISVFADEGFMKTFLFVENRGCLSSSFIVEPESINIVRDTANLRSKNGQIYTFHVVDSRSKMCVKWLKMAAEESMPVLIRLVKDKDNIIGHVGPPIKEVQERYKKKMSQELFH